MTNLIGRLYTGPAGILYRYETEWTEQKYYMSGERYELKESVCPHSGENEIPVHIAKPEFYITEGKKKGTTMSGFLCNTCRKLLQFYVTKDNNIPVYNGD